jgi:cytochrome c oxidase subunit 2
MSGGIPFLPATASTAAHELNVLFAALLAIAGAVLGLVVLLLLTFCIRYRRSRETVDRTHRSTKSWRWEIGWTTASFIVFIGLYAWGADLYLREHRADGAASEIYVVGKQWMWKVEHPDGQREINALHVALGRSVRLVMTSEDVIHGFYVPAFRLKQDVLPGRYVTMSFTPTKVGNFPLFCSQFCGVDHAAMLGSVFVMTQGDYQRWLSRNAMTGTLAAAGGALFRRLGCSGCHAASSTVRAPLLSALYGRPVALRDGSVVIADENFIRNAILQPGSSLPSGYDAIMPSFAGQVDEEGIVSLVAYIKSLSKEAPSR